MIARPVRGLRPFGVEITPGSSPDQNRLHARRFGGEDVVVEAIAHIHDLSGLGTGGLRTFSKKPGDGFSIPRSAEMRIWSAPEVHALEGLARLGGWLPAITIRFPNAPRRSKAGRTSG